MYAELEEALVDFLAIIYGRVPWGKMRTSKNPHDIFNHRVRAASRRDSLFTFASKLSNYFGLQSIPEEALEKLEILRPYQYWVLNTLSKEHIPFCVKAIIRAKAKKAKMKEDTKNTVEKIENENENEINLFNNSEIENDSEI
ncbi:MAG: hypothetical protein CH6_0089 [Candidatus Kapaibacterium sp.]|nr:MAG: hypothetical protein CH6_0089 [Candidatus Kapabacteria bacterium]